MTMYRKNNHREQNNSIKTTHIGYRDWQGDGENHSIFSWFTPKTHNYMPSFRPFYWWLVSVSSNRYKVLSNGLRLRCVPWTNKNDCGPIYGPQTGVVSRYLHDLRTQRSRSPLQIYNQKDTRLKFVKSASYRDQGLTATPSGVVIKSSTQTPLKWPYLIHFAESYLPTWDAHLASKLWTIST